MITTRFSIQHMWSGLALMLLTVLCGCATNTIPLRSNSSLLFSVRLTEGAFSGSIDKDYGYFFYGSESADGSDITVYHMIEGQAADYLGGGWYESDKLRQQLKNIDFEPFDFEKETQRIDQLLAEKPELVDDSIPRILTCDGAKYEILYKSGGRDFSLEYWNPGPVIDFYAHYSPKIAKLKGVIDAFKLYYATSTLGL